MKSPWFATGAIAAALGVGLGAFGAHGLKGRVGADLLVVFETGVRYHLLHALALLVVGLAANTNGGRSVAGWAFVVGIVLFSGSLYVMTFTGQRWLGAVTPFGGVAFLVGWVALATASLRLR